MPFVVAKVLLVFEDSMQPLGDVPAYHWTEASDGAIFKEHSMTRPFLIRSIANPDEWPGIAKWARISHLRKELAGQSVSAHHSSDDRQFQDGVDEAVRLIPWEDAVDAVFDPQGERCYVKLAMCPEIRKALPVLSGRPFGPDSAGRLREPLTKLWMGSSGNVTPLHFDLCHGCLTQIVGRKRVWLFPPSESKWLYPNSANTPGCTVRTSRVDLPGLLGEDEDSRAQLKKFPQTANAVGGLVCEVTPGECLYIPPFWWHCVEAIDANVSLLMPFDISVAEQRCVDRPWTRDDWGRD